MSKEELNKCLKCFYTSARKKDGTYYKNTSMKSIRAAIDRFLRSPPNNEPFSIISDAVFTEANEVLNAFVKDLRKTGKIAGVVHKNFRTKFLNKFVNTEVRQSERRNFPQVFFNCNVQVHNYYGGGESGKSS